MNEEIAHKIQRSNLNGFNAKARTAGTGAYFRGDLDYFDIFHIESTLDQSAKPAGYIMGKKEEGSPSIRDVKIGGQGLLRKPKPATMLLVGRIHTTKLQNSWRV